MRGHEQLIEMRRAGYVPRVVMLDIGHDKLRMAADWLSLKPQIAYLTIVETETPSPADLRCVYGLLVLVQGDDRRSVMAARDACIEAKAKRVVATVIETLSSEPNYERYAVAEMTDTEGEAVWPK